LIKEKNPEMPVIALTANAFESDRQMAIEAGCVEFLTKPISSQRCLAAIAQFVGE
jgi:CheY-like chemotaxis protein